MSNNIVILGSGESGMGAAQLAIAKGDSVFLSDYGQISKENKAQLNTWGIEYEEEQHTLEKVLQADYIIKSPGIPDNVAVVKEAFNTGVPVISEVEYAFYHVPKGARIIAITGTNGKTTTTLLTYHLLEVAGLNAAVGGNVGISFARQVAQKDFDYYVVEVSSFQLDGIIKFRPDIGILLNITPDHLDRYDYDFNKYVASKFRITENLTEEEFFIYCSDSIPVTKELSQRNVDACLFAISATKNEIESAFIDQDHLIFNFTYKEATRYHKIPISEINLIGKHNMINTMAAVLAALSINIGIEKIIKGLKSFDNAPHRLEVVRSIDGVRYINDSKATNIDSVYYALDGIDESIVWIAGGIDKGNDYTQLKELVRKKVKGLVCLGTDNKKIREFFSEYVDMIEETKSMQEAVLIARNWATGKDVVLLSPACASFDLFKNYEDRGNQFKEAVSSLHQKTRQV